MPSLAFFRRVNKPWAPLLLAACLCAGQPLAQSAEPANAPAPAPDSASDLETDFAPAPASAPTPVPASAAAFRVVAYIYNFHIPDPVPYQQLTHIIYAGLQVKSDGTFAPLAKGDKTDKLDKIKTLVKQAHENKVKVLISIGGWGLGDSFGKAAATAQTRAVFVREILKVLDEYQFDGVDMDWEFPSHEKSSRDFLALMRELRAALPDKLLTAAVAKGGNGAAGIPDESIPLMDFINVMTYDGGAEHGTMKQFKAGLALWRKRGVPPEKLVMGIPFYSRPGSVKYHELVKQDPAAARHDTCVYNGKTEHYNGIPTVRKKTAVAMEKASGIMFWNLGGDAAGDASLLNAIHQMVVESGRAAGH